MTKDWADIRATLVAAAACLAAALVITELPYVALPLCALALAGMTFRGRSVAAAFMAGGTAAIAAVLTDPLGAVIAIVGLTGVLFAIAWLAKGSPWVSLLALAAGYSASFVAVDAGQAWLTGESLSAALKSAAVSGSELAEIAVSIVGTQPEAADAQELSETLFMTWPASYIVTGTVTAILVVMAVSFVARRYDRPQNTLPKLADIDVSPHVLWLPIVGVLALVASKLVAEQEYVLMALGLNVLLIARPLFAWQGFGVVAGKLDQFSAKGTVRVLAYAIALLAEAFVFAVSLVGFLDLVANYRKIKRVDQVPQDGAEGSASST